MTMTRKTLISAGALALSSLLLAGCMSSNAPSDRPPMAAQPTGVEGDWVGADGVAVSSIRGGQFSSRAASTGETLTNGTYVARDQRTIDLDFFSIKSQKRTRATCLLVDVNQMNCTLDSGTQFVLSRKLA